MSGKILVAYASKYGATKEIAGKISEALQKSGKQADFLPVGEVKGLSDYQAVVLGSGVYIGKWRRKAAEFLRDNEKALAERPVWLFSSGPTGKGDPVELVDGKRLPAALQPVAGHIKPRDIAVFHGYMNMAKMSFIERWAIKRLVRKPFGDFRDWDAIRKWAEGIAEALKGQK